MCVYIYTHPHAHNKSFLHGCWVFPWSFCTSFLSFCFGGGRYREQVQYLCLISHSSNNSRPSIYHMDMVCRCLWPHTLQGFSPLPFHPLVAVPAFWLSPVLWEASPTFQLKMRRSTMTMITKEVRAILSGCQPDSTYVLLRIGSGCHCLSVSGFNFIID